MIQDLIDIFPNSLWLRIDKDKLQLMNHDGTVKKTEYPIQPYHHPRSFFADYVIATNTLKTLLKDLSNFQKSMSNCTLLQIMEQPEGGLTPIELRALQEFAYEAGIPHIVIYDQHGQALTDEPNTSTINAQWKILKIGAIVIIILIMIMVWSIYQYH